ncbi:MAG: ABC transporter substrate-binding protein [Lachnospiraceae bacterium]|nr:ABC transporter substrate-binding protein [Lachnospiraceae bacterium]
MKKGKGLLSLILVMLMTTTIALGGCAGDKAGGTSFNDSITIGIPQDLDDSLDPHVVSAAGTREILFNIYEGLLKYDSTGSLNCAIAESYDISDDNVTYTFTLREGVKFHDGSTVTVEDVIYSIERCAGTSEEEPLVPAFSNIAEISAPDERTVVIVLNAPDTEFLAALTSAVIPASNTDVENNVIGTGPYRFVSRTPQESVELVAFEEYWGERAHITNITLKVCSNADAVVMELLGGSIDMYCRITSSQAAELAGSQYQVLEGTMNLVQAMYLNNAVEPFDDVRVRQALCYAINPQEIMDFVSDGQGTEIGSSMFPAFSKYYMEELNHVYDQDLDRARELLAEAGYPDGFTFTMTVPSNYQPHIDTAQVLVEQLEAIGVTAEINLVEWDTWLSDVYVGRNFESTVVGVDASELTARALLERFTSDFGKNFINFNSAAYDEAFANAISTTDDALQTQYYQECMTILAEEAANVYIQDLPTFVAINENIGGYEFYPLYVQNFASLYIIE